jgi:hypothetical protein
MDERARRVFDGYDPETRARLLSLRETIYDVAAKTEGVYQLKPSVA